MKQRITITMLLLWILSCFVSLGTAYASPITSQQAQQNAMDFLKKKGKTVSKTALRDVSSKDASSKNYYVFNIGTNEGFVIAAADDQVPAILGYSSRGTVLIEAMPDNLKAWLDSYDKQISYIQEQGIKGSTPITSTHAAISPLMTTTWNQTDPYNQSCPDFFTYGKSVTGCVATAMAQVMYYHRNRSVNQIAATIPAYTCEREWNIDSGTQQISVESVPAGSVIDWDNMLTNYTGSETAVQKKAIADFMFYCGASVSMDYANRSSGGSAAYSEDVSGALKTYFGYSDNTQLVSRDNYTNDSWDNLIYNELSNNRPVFYSGVTSSGGGHAFVCDGYDSDGYYHINWGWGGYCDTYFLLSDLTPQDQGTGGSSGGYNNSQQALIGAEPSGNVTPPVQQYNVSVSAPNSGEIHLFDRNGNDISGTSLFDAGSYIRIEPQIPVAMYIKEILVNGVSIGTWNDEDVQSGNSPHDYTIESLSGNMQIEFRTYLYPLYRTLTSVAKGPGSVKMYKNGNYIGTTTNNGTYNVISSVFDTGDILKLVFVPDESCQFKQLLVSEHGSEYGGEMDFTNDVNNNTFTIAFNDLVKDETLINRCFEAYFEGKSNYTINFSWSEESESFGGDIFCYDENDNNLFYAYPGNETTFTYEAGKYLRIYFQDHGSTSLSYFYDITINGVSIGGYKGSELDLAGFGHSYSYEINSLSSDINVVITGKRLPVDVGVLAKGPGSVHLYRNGSFVSSISGSDEDGSSLYFYNKDELKLQFIPNEGCRLLKVLNGYGSNAFFDHESEMDDITSQVQNNTLTSVISYGPEGYIVYFEEILPTSHDLTISASGNGSATYSGMSILNNSQTFSVEEGANATITFTPDTGYRIKSVKKDGVDVFPSVVNNQYTVSNITTNTTIAVTFEVESSGVVLNSTNFPDATFREYISNLTGVAEGETISNEKLQAVTTINVNDKGISSLKGIEFFASLTELKCYHNKLTSIDLSNNTLLTRFECSSNKLTNIDVSALKALTDLSCNINQLTSLDLSRNIELTKLSCQQNQLIYLDLSKNPKLTSLYCPNNLLTSLGISNCTALIDLDCENNQLTSLDVSKCTVLTRLYCDNNQLTSLDMPNYDMPNSTPLTDLSCNNNQLTSLDVSKCTTLTSLYCNNNQLTSLDMSNNTLLASLQCCDNKLRYLDVSKNTRLGWLSSYGNQLMSIDLSNCTQINGPISPQSLSLAVSSNGSSQYSITIPPGFITSNVSGFTVDGTNTTPTVNNGRLFFTSTTTPQTLIYQYETNNSVIGKMDVTVNITGLEEDDAGVTLNATNFPDPTFRTYISKLTGVAEGGTISNNRLQEVKTINVSKDWYPRGNISTLKGVEFFTELKSLNCSFNQLTSIDLSNNNALTSVDCSNNRLESLDISTSAALTRLDCSWNQLTSLDVSNNTALMDLDCFANRLTSLEVSSNTALTSLSCYANRITSLDVSNNTRLRFLNCGINQLTSLDVSNNPALTSLSCYNNQLTSLDVTRNTALDSLNCSHNQLSQLNVTNNRALKWLYCYYNKITNLYVMNNTALKQLLCGGNKLPSLNISRNTNLEWLYCYDNLLVNLDVSKNTGLTILDCVNNQLMSLNVSNCTALTDLYCFNNQLSSLDVSNCTSLTSLSCYNNQLSSLDVSNNIRLASLMCNGNQLTSLDVQNNTALYSLACGYHLLMNLDVSNNTQLRSIYGYEAITASIGSNQYYIPLPLGFDISRVSSFKVNGVSTTPSVVAGTLVFASLSIPQTINYEYNQANSVVAKIYMTIHITAIEEASDNIIYMDDMEVLSGTEAVLSVKMKNEVVAEGFEFDMYLPEGITVVQDEDGFPEVTLSTERTTARKTNSFDAIFNADGSLRVLAASTNGSTISGNDGEVVQVKVAIADDMAEGDYTVCFKNIAISDENAESHTSAMTTSTIKVNTYIIGDANIDRKVDVADFTAVAHHLLNNTPQSFHMKAADANTDNRIDVGDLTAIAHLILYGTITKPTNTSGAKPFMMMNGSPADENYIYIEPVSVQRQSEVTLSVKMRNAVEAEGFEFDLYLPDGMSFVTDAEGFAEVSLSTERTNSRKTNSFDSVIQEDGSLRVLAASTNGSSISGNDGEVALVTIHIDPNLAAAEYPLLLKNIAIADVNAVSHSTDLKESTITILYNGIITGIDGVDEMDDNADWYMLDGKKLNSKPKARGVYIMNGQKVVIK